MSQSVSVRIYLYVYKLPISDWDLIRNYSNRMYRQDITKVYLINYIQQSLRLIYNEFSLFSLVNTKNLNNDLLTEKLTDIILGFVPKRKRT